MADNVEYQYCAFISYRHVEPDRSWAKWLHSSLENYVVPHQLQRERQLPGRLGKVFRDEEELAASADLNVSIESALQASRFLIVVCSPRTPESEWVNQEVVRFREMGRGDRILALLIEGEPEKSFPRSLCEIRDPASDSPRVGRIEPLAADVRETQNEGIRSRRRMAKMRILATLLGCRFDELRQRESERRQRRLAQLSVGLAALVLSFAALTFVAIEARDDATLKAEVILKFVSALGTPDPYREGRETTLLTFLKSFEKQLDAVFSNTPDMEATIRNTIGVTYLHLGDMKYAESNLRRASSLRQELYGTSNLEVATSQANMAEWHFYDGNFGEAVRLFRQSLSTRTKLLPDRDELVADTMYNLGQVLYERGDPKLADIEEASKLYESLFEIRYEVDPEYQGIADIVNQRAYMMVDIGELEIGEGWRQWVVQRDRASLRRTHPHLATGLNNLGLAMVFQGLAEEGRPHILEALEIRRQEFGESSTVFADSIRALAYADYVSGNLDVANRDLRKALALQERQNARVAAAFTQGILAAVLADSGSEQEAKEFYEESVDGYVGVLGHEHHHLILIYHFFRGAMRHQRSNFDGAERLLRHAIAEFTRLRGNKNAHLAAAMDKLALVLRDLRRYDESESLSRQALAMRAEVLGTSHPSYGSGLLHLGTILLARNEFVEAEKLLRKASQHRRKLKPQIDWLVAMAESELGQCLSMMGQPDEASSLLLSSYETLRSSFSDSHPRTQLAAARWKMFNE